MRPLKVITAAGLLVASISLVSENVQAKDFYKMSTLSPGSSPFLVMSAFAAAGQKNNKNIEIQINATGAATVHALEAARGKIHFFMSSPALYRLLKKGKAMYKKVKNAGVLSKNLASIMAFSLGAYHATVYEDSGMKRLDDIKGKKVFLGPPGGAARRLMTNMVKSATGLVPGKDFTSVKLGWSAAAAAFQDRQIDVWFSPSIPPSPSISQVALTNKIRFLGLDAEDVTPAKLKEFLGVGGHIYRIPPDVYGKNQMNSEPTATRESIGSIATRKNVSADLIYQLTKSFWEAREETAKNAPWLRKVMLKNVFQDLEMPLHPGAKRYYKEIGLKVPSHL